MLKSIATTETGEVALSVEDDDVSIVITDGKKKIVLPFVELNDVTTFAVSIAGAAQAVRDEANGA